MWTDTALKVIVASLLHFPVAVWFSNWEECLGKGTRIPVLGACLLLNSPAQVGLCLIHSSVVSTCMDMQHWHCCFRYYCLYLFSQALLVTQQEGSNLLKMTVPE